MASQSKDWKEWFMIALTVIGFLIASLATIYTHFIEKEVTRLEARIEAVNTTIHQRINRLHGPH